jgi:hypothetical protein
VPLLPWNSAAVLVVPGNAIFFSAGSELSAVKKKARKLFLTRERGKGKRELRAVFAKK